MTERELHPVDAEPRPAGPEAEIDLRRFLQVATRRKWSIIALTIAGVLLSVLVTIRAPRIYRTSTTLLLEHHAPDVLTDVREVYDPGASNYWNIKEFYETQYRVMRSFPVLDRVASRLGIQPKDIAERLRNAPAPSLGARVAAAPLDELPAELKEKLDLLGFGNTAGRDTILKALERFDAVKFLEGRIRVEPIKDSRLAQITVEDTSPERAALVANAVADAYLEINLEQKTGMTRSAADWLADQIQDLKSKLDTSERGLHDFKKDNSMVSVTMEDRQSMIAQTLSQLNVALSTVLTQRLSLESRRNALGRAKSGELAPDAIDIIKGSTLIQNLKSTRSELRREEADLALRYTDEHPLLASVRKKLQLVEAELQAEIGKLLASLDEEYRAVSDNERRLRAEIHRVKDEALELGKRETEYNRLKRENDNNLVLFNMVVKRQKEAELTQLLKINNVRKLEAARTPFWPVRPRVRVNVALGLLFGLVAGIALAFVRDHLDNTIKHAEQLSDSLGVAILGIVPSIREDKGETKMEHDPERDLFILSHPRSSVAECCRSIRTNLLFMSPDKPAKTLLVTSPGPREGKSTAAIYLAITMAQSGARVLLVDADMRKPRLHKTFNLNNDFGLSNCILGEVAFSDAAQATQVPSLSVMTCGPIPPNPVELLHTDRFKQLVEDLRRRYDRIIFDSPPANAVADSVVLASMLDGCVLVTRANQTAWPHARDAMRRLVDVGGHMMGAVLNNVDIESGQYGGYYYYYRYGYGEGGTKKAAG